MTQPHDDEYGVILRRVLRAEANEVTPSAEGLERIRTGIDARAARRLWWQMPWVRPAMAMGGALVLAAVVMAGTPSIRQSVIAAFQPTTPTGPASPYHPPSNNQGYPTNGPGTGSPSPTGSGGPSQGPGGGPCGDPGGDDSGGQVTTLRTPSASSTPTHCATTPPPQTQTEEPTTPSSPTTRPDSPPPHTTPPPQTSGSPSTDPKPSDSHPDPVTSP